MRTQVADMHVESGWLTAAIAAGGTAVASFLLFLGQRLIGRAALDTMMNQKFNTFIDQLQEERAAYREETTILRKELITERAARQDEQILTSAERASLRGEIRNLMQVIESLKAIMRDHGIPVPEARHTSPAPRAVELRQGLEDADND